MPFGLHAVLGCNTLAKWLVLILHADSIRLAEHDYHRCLTYFVTVCSHGRSCLFGVVVGGQVALNRLGQVVREEWLRTAELRPYVTLGAFMVMPNHFHSLVTVGDDGRAQHAVPLQGTSVVDGRRRSFGRLGAESLPAVVRAFKSASTKRIRDELASPSLQVWQRNYYEHIVRDEDDLARIHDYILDNPAHWAQDEENPGPRPLRPLPGLPTPAR